MDFRKALIKALNICGERAVDPTLLYYALCDAIGNDLQLKPQAEAFHHFNQSCQIVETMAKSPDPRMILTLLETYKAQPDAPEQLCLKWIHALFEVYYHTKRTDRAPAERIGQSVEKKLFDQGAHSEATLTPSLQCQRNRPKAISQIQVPPKKQSPNAPPANKAPSIRQITIAPAPSPTHPSSFRAVAPLPQSSVRRKII